MNDVVRVGPSAAAVARSFPQISLIVLFGSRSRGDAREDSDWDLAYVATAPLDALDLRARFVDALGTDRIDLVDLDRASALLRFRVARDGAPVFVRSADAFERFWTDAVRVWCDVEPLVRAGHAEILADLRR